MKKSKVIIIMSILVSLVVIESICILFLLNKNKNTTDTIFDLKLDGFYVYKTRDEIGEIWYGFAFMQDGTVIRPVNLCPGSGCGAFSEDGTYEKNGNNIIITMTHMTNEMGRNKLDKIYSIEVAIIDESNIKFDNDIYTHQKEFWQQDEQ